MITHNLQDALEYGNRLIVMHRGEIIEDFTKEAKDKLNLSRLYEILSELD